jgi:hypothetical protein
MWASWGVTRSRKKEDRQGRERTGKGASPPPSPVGRPPPAAAGGDWAVERGLFGGGGGASRVTCEATREARAELSPRLILDDEVLINFQKKFVTAVKSVVQK